MWVVMWAWLLSFLCVSYHVSYLLPITPLLHCPIACFEDCLLSIAYAYVLIAYCFGSHRRKAISSSSFSHCLELFWTDILGVDSALALGNREYNTTCNVQYMHIQTYIYLYLYEFIHIYIYSPEIYKKYLPAYSKQDSKHDRLGEANQRRLGAACFLQGSDLLFIMIIN